MKISTTQLFACLLALALCVTPAVAQQGEGTAGDHVLTTAVNGGASDTADKTMCTNDTLTCSISSPMGTGAGGGFILAGDIGPVSIDVSEGPGGVLGLGFNRFILVNGISNGLGPAVPAGGATVDITFVIPSNPVWVDGAPFSPFAVADAGLFLQSGAQVPGGSFFGFEISETMKHEVDSRGEIFRDTCAEALNCGGLTNLDLGVPLNVDTTTYTDTLDTIGQDFSFGTQSGVEIAIAGEGDGAAGSGVSPDAIGTFTASNEGLYSFSLAGSDFDTRLWLMDPALGCPASGAPVTSILFNEDAVGLTSGLSDVLLDGGDQLLIVIDGWDGSAGNAELIITRVDPPPPPSCSPTESASNAPGLSVGNIGLPASVSDTVTILGVGLVESLTVDVTITHTFIGDLNIDTTSPSATTLRLWATSGGSGQNIIGTFEDGGALDPSAFGNGPLSTFNGEDMDGDWTLDIGDTFPGSDGGSLKSWGVNLNAPQAASYSGAGSHASGFGNAGLPDSETSTVTAGATNINNVTVDVVITHTFVGDLNIDLTSAQATTLRLWATAGGSGVDIVGTFEDGGALDPSAFGNGPLSTFDGECALGDWTLDIGDTFPGSDGGSLKSWSLNLN